MKTHFSVLLFFVSIIPLTCRAQGGEWVWLNGSNQGNQPAVFGTMGVADTGNTPGGLYEAAYWIDGQGNFWIFGGVEGVLNPSGSYSNLWKFDPIQNSWTFVKGPLI